MPQDITGLVLQIEFVGDVQNEGLDVFGRNGGGNGPWPR